MKPIPFILIILLFAAQVVLMLVEPYDVHAMVHVILSALMIMIISTRTNYGTR